MSAQSPIHAGRFARTIVTAALALAGAVAVGSGAAYADTGLAVLAGDVYTGPATLLTGATSPDTPVQVGITLANPNQAAQDALYAALYTPGSPQYHQFLSADDVAAQFGVPASTFSQVQAWATRDGMRAVFSPSTDEYLLLSGTAGQAEQTFSVALQNLTVNGASYYVNVTPPTVPAGFGIVGVVGLNNLLRSHTFHDAPPATAAHGTAPAQSNCVGGSCIGLTTAQDLWSIYGMPTNLADPSQDFGQGQQMAVLGEGAVAGPLSDLRAFERERGLPQIPITIKSVGDDFQDTSGSGEWDIDTQASTGIAPKAYGETWIFGKDLTDSSILADFTAFSDTRNGPMQANASFGECEQDPTSPVTAGGVITSYGGLVGDAGAMFTQASENALQQATLQGKTLFASTGDTGSSCPVVFAAVIGAGNGVLNQGIPETNYPASSRYAVAVGGTLLYGTPNTATPSTSNSVRSQETAWTFTGGGNTFYIPEPTYQKGISLLDNQPCISQPTGVPYASPTPCRGIPDVAAQSGDVITNGYAITSGGVNDQPGGGTSLSSPLWMGMWTRIQAATLKPQKGVFTQGFANPTLYRVAADPTQDAASFFDIGSGGTVSPITGNGYYTSLPRTAADPTGWDYVSGLGSPNVQALGVAATGNTKFSPTRNISAPAPMDCGQPGLVSCTSTSCSGTSVLWTNPAHTATDTLGNSDPQLSLLDGAMSLSADGTTLRTFLTVTNLNGSVPTGAGAAEWYVTWTYNNTMYFANAELSAVPGSAPTFHDGTVTQTGNTSNFSNNSSHTNDTGSFTPGPNGIVEIDVPLANVGGPPIGAVLTTPAALTDILVGTAAAGGLLERVDTGGPTCQETLGTGATP
jgi:subtilase family serine protease